MTQIQAETAASGSGEGLGCEANGWDGRTPNLSFVVPVMNEEESLRELVDGILNVCEGRGESLEIIFVDDGSTDGSWEQVRLLADEHPELVKGIKFRRNMGKAHALSAGFKEVRGTRIVTMDGDLQDDPEEIPRMLDRASQGFDLVVGWKKDRLDPSSKVISSRIFNWLANKVSGLELHDHNCGFKCYSRELLEELRLYGDMHRMVPSLASSMGFTIAEVPVRHHARRYGVSKYGFGRGMRSFMDLWTVMFLRHFRDRPSHFIGPMAFLMLICGVCSLGIGLYRDITTGEGKVFLTVGPMAVIVALTLFNTSLVAEMLVHEHFSKDWGHPISARTGGRSPQEISRQPAGESKARQGQAKVLH